MLSCSWKNPALTEKGRAEALEGGKNLKAAGYTHFDVAFTSVLQRANDTLAIILKEIGQEGLETHKDQALNERDYGELTGLNKDDGAFALAVRCSVFVELTTDSLRPRAFVAQPARSGVRSRSTSGAARTTSLPRAASRSS